MSQNELPMVDARLAESEERYRTVIENASDMIQSVRPDGTFEFVNSAWLNALGYNLEEVGSLNIWDIIHADSVEHCQILFSKALQGDPISYMEAVFKTRDGQPLPVEGNVTSRMIGDDVVATHGFFRDTFERIRARELEERNLHLEQEQQARYLEKMAALGKLSAGLAHELNNPAAAVQRASADMLGTLSSRETALRRLADLELTAAEWLKIDHVAQTVSAETGLVGQSGMVAAQEEEALEEWLRNHNVANAWEIAPALAETGITADLLDPLAEALPEATLAPALDWLNETASIHQSVRIIQRSSHRISELVTAIKGYSHMDRATEQTVDIHEGLENTLIILGHRLQNVTIQRSYDHGIPPIRVFGNTLNQVWTNILDNAIDAMGGKGIIGIRTRLEDDRVIVEIEDNGSGISPDDLACIFEPFYTTKPQGLGTGLGLDTAWRIVTEEHGGTITAESQPGQTVFRMSLPVTDPATA